MVDATMVRSKIVVKYNQLAEFASTISPLPLVLRKITYSN